MLSQARSETGGLPICPSAHLQNRPAFPPRPLSPFTCRLFPLTRLQKFLPLHHNTLAPSLCIDRASIKFQVRIQVTSFLSLYRAASNYLLSSLGSFGSWLPRHSSLLRPVATASCLNNPSRVLRSTSLLRRRRPSLRSKVSCNNLSLSNPHQSRPPAKTCSVNGRAAANAARRQRLSM
jgi:hypothetical protein